MDREGEGVDVALELVDLVRKGEAVGTVPTASVPVGVGRRGPIIMRISRTRGMAGAAALVACTQYFIAEAIAAAAWHHPPYSYARNFISDLGMPDCPSALGGRIVCSPLAAVMNTGFLIEGALVVLALVLLSPMLAGRSWRVAATVLSLIHAFGVATVGIWHASAAAPGAISLHETGAFMAIIGGNVAIAVVGVAAWRGGAPGWFALSSAGMGLSGLGSAAALSSTNILPPGIFERLAVDGISVWKITTGLLLVFALFRSRLEPSSQVQAPVASRS